MNKIPETSRTTFSSFSNGGNGISNSFNVQVKPRGSCFKDLQTSQLKILEENHTATLASFDLEILNFQSLTRPFGLKHSVYSAGRLKDFEVDSSNPEEEKVFLTPVTKTDYHYKYNGQEWQDELGLNMYAMDLRQYDPAIGRWVAQDPVTHFEYSPYNAFDNNPVFWADPSGADAVDIGYDRIIDSQDMMGSYHWSGGFQEIENEGRGTSLIESKTTITETFEPISESGNVGNDKIRMHEEKTIRTTYLDNDGHAITRSVKFVTIHDVIIDKDGNVGSISYTQYSYLNDKSHGTTSKNLSPDSDLLPKSLIAKMNSAIQYKKTNFESPRQTEAAVNSKENTNLIIISGVIKTGSGWLWRNVQHPAGKIGGAVGFMASGGMDFYIKYINSSDPEKINVISTNHETKRINY